jgi:hypothetical protein
MDINIMGEEEWVRKEIKRDISIGHNIFYSSQYCSHCW